MLGIILGLAAIAFFASKQKKTLSSYVQQDSVNPTTGTATLGVNTILAAFVAAQNSSDTSLDIIAKQLVNVPTGTYLKGACTTVAGLIRGKNLPAPVYDAATGQIQLSGALSALTTMLYSYDPSPANMRLYAQALSAAKLPKIAETFTARANQLASGKA